nr:14964_t:CDS:10 [Entrophospora candida]
MAKVYTLQDTKSMESKKIQGQGYRLSNVREQEFEEALHDSIKSNSELSNDFKNLQVVYSKFSNNIKQKNAQLQRNLKQAVSIQNTLSEKSSELELLQSEIKTLEAKLDLAQKDSSMKESEVLSLKSKLAELSLKLPSGEAKLRISDSSAVSGGNKKNISNVSQKIMTRYSKQDLETRLRRIASIRYLKKKSGKSECANDAAVENKLNGRSKPTRPTRTSDPSQSTTEFDSYGGSNPTANPSTSYSNYSNSNSNDPEQKPLWKNIEKNYCLAKKKREFERQQVDQAAMEREQQKEQEKRALVKSKGHGELHLDEETKKFHFNDLVTNWENKVAYNPIRGESDPNAKKDNNALFYGTGGTGPALTPRNEDYKSGIDPLNKFIFTLCDIENTLGDDYGFMHEENGEIRYILFVDECDNVCTNTALSTDYTKLIFLKTYKFIRHPDALKELVEETERDEKDNEVVTKKGIQLREFLEFFWRLSDSKQLHNFEVATAALFTVPICEASLILSPTARGIAGKIINSDGGDSGNNALDRTDREKIERLRKEAEQEKEKVKHDNEEVDRLNTVINNFHASEEEKSNARKHIVLLEDENKDIKEKLSKIGKKLMILLAEKFGSSYYFTDFKKFLKKNNYDHIWEDLKKGKIDEEYFDALGGQMIFQEANKKSNRAPKEEQELTNLRNRLKEFENNTENKPFNYFP